MSHIAWNSRRAKNADHFYVQGFMKKLRKYTDKCTTGKGKTSRICRFKFEIIPLSDQHRLLIEK